MKPARRDFLKGVAFGGVLSAIQFYQGRRTVRGQAPDLDVVALSRQPLPSGARLVHFWATWCGVCHAMEHNIRAVDGERMVMVASASGSPADVRRWLGAEDKSPENVVVDAQGTNARAWGVTAYPTTFVVGGDGAIRDAAVGYTTELGLRLRLAFAG